MVTVKVYVMVPLTPRKVDGKFLQWDKESERIYGPQTACGNFYI